MKLQSWMKQSALWLMCFVSALLPVAAQAQNKPVAVVSFAGYDALIADLNYVGELSGAPQLAQSLEGILALVTRAQGLAGLDKSKPIGASLTLSEGGAPTPLIFIPVTDVDKLLDALQGVVPNVEDLGDGFSKIRLPNGLPLVMKVSEGWAFLSMSQESLADLPKDPAKLLGDLPAKYDLAVQLNIQNIPAPLLQFAIDQVNRGAEPGLRQKDGESDTDYETRKKFTEATLEQVTQAIEEIDHITVGYAIDKKEEGALLDLELTVKEGGKLAKQLIAAKEAAKPSKLAGFADEEAVANFHFTSPILEDDAKTILGAIEMGREQAAKKIDESEDLEGQDIKDAVKKMVSDIFDVAAATIEGGQVNGAAAIYGEGPFELFAAGLVVDAKKLEKVVKKAVELFGDAPDFPDVEFDADEKGGVTYHNITVPVADPEAQKVFGEEVTISLGFGKNLVVVAVAEEDGVESAAEIVADNAGADELPPAQLQVRLGPIVQFAVDNDEDAKKPAKELAELLADVEHDHVSFVTDYIPNGQRTRISIEEGLLQAFGKAVVAGMQGGR